MRRKILLSILFVLLLSVLSTLNSTIPMVSAAVSPYIAVVPESSVDPSLTPGMNYTISIYTDYTGDDVNGYGFELTYNASVLEGIEVVNGDLINTTTMFFSVGFNNTAGRLMYTTNNLPFFAKPAPLTSGPGTLANVTFRVVAKGTSNITFEDQGDFRAMLVGYLDDGHGDPYLIIDSETMPDQIQHGYFANNIDMHVSQTPPEDNVLPEDEVEINATVVDELNEVKHVTLNYTNGNGTWFTINMTNPEGDIWNATIPAFPYGTNITYIILAEDNVGNTVTSEELGYEYQYQVIPEFPSFHIIVLFAIATLLAVITRIRKQFT
jgi:hypothetical protein